LIPALKTGKVVIADRCHFWSAVAYGLWENSEDYDVNMAQSLLVTHGVATRAYQFIIPDRTFYLDISLETALQRMAGKSVKKDIYEKEETLAKIKQGYSWLLKEFPEEFVVINGEKSIEAVSQAIATVLT
jgi:thymidylate kinase